MPQNRSVPDVTGKREEWKLKAAALDCKKLVFLDESGVNINLTRRYGRSQGGCRVVDKTPLNTPKSTTILSSIRMDGSAVYEAYSGGTSGERFIEYLKNNLVPTLRKGDIVIMDNMRTHHISAVREILEQAGMELLYLPPYSPDLNPIEKLWSKIKSILRKLKARTPETLLEAIAQAFSCILPSDCVGWFRASGLCV
jgi:transposase